MNGLDLFSGIGGISLALRPWVRTVAYCEIDSYARKVLEKNIDAGCLDEAPIHPDVTKLTGENFNERIDIITAGFPCQDISVAGRGKGLEGERSRLFFEILRLSEEVKPTFIFLENVPAIRVRGLGTVVTQLAHIGYDSRWCALSASEVGAPHQRNRWWCLAANLDTGNNGAQAPLANAYSQRSKSTETVGPQRIIEFSEHSDIRACSTDAEHGTVDTPMRQQDTFSAGWWTTEPDVGRVAHGVSHRVDRIRCLGNAVVPLQAREAFRYLIGEKK